MSASAATSSGSVTLGSVMQKFFGSVAARFRGQLSKENIQRANAALAKLFRKGLDADADEGRQLARVHS